MVGDGLENWLSFLGVLVSDQSPDMIMTKMDLDPYAKYPRLPQAEIKKRNEKIIELRMAGLTYSQIGQKTGTSKYTAFKECKKAGLVS